MVRFDKWDDEVENSPLTKMGKALSKGKAVIPVKVSEFGNPDVNSAAFGEADFGSEYAFLSYAKKLKPIPAQRKQKTHGKRYRGRRL